MAVTGSILRSCDPTSLQRRLSTRQGWHFVIVEWIRSSTKDGMTVKVHWIQDRSWQLISVSVMGTNLKDGDAFETAAQEIAFVERRFFAGRFGDGVLLLRVGTAFAALIDPMQRQSGGGVAGVAVAGATVSSSRRYHVRDAANDFHLFKSIIHSLLGLAVRIGFLRTFERFWQL